MARLTMLAAALAFAALAALPGGSKEFRPWPGAGFARAEIRDVASAEIYPKGEPRSFPYRLDLTLVRLEKTNWTDERVLRQLRKTANIFAACEIGIGDAQLARVRVDSRLRQINATEMVAGTQVPRDVYDLSRQVPAAAHWPVIFFVESLRGDSALARSFQQGDVASADLPKYPYMNTAWVSYRTHWIERRDDGYSTPAHEIAHLLCRCGHVYRDEPHLLNTHKNFLSTKILPEHCESFRKSPLVRPSKDFESLQ